MQTRSYVFFAFALALSASTLSSAMPAAHAATLTNRDQTVYQIDVTIGEIVAKHDLAPGKVLAGFCPEGCIIRLNGKPENDYVLEGSERVSIERGLVYYDGEEVPPKAEAAPAKPSK